MENVAETRNRIARLDPHFRALLQKHEDYDRRLSELQSRKYLTHDEQMEEVRLKKLKLACKDEMQTIIRRLDS